MLYFLHVNINKTWGTCKVRNEIETKRNETDRNDFFPKRNVTKKKGKIQYGMKTKRVYNILVIQI
jgi:hypothetical protein